MGMKRILKAKLSDCIFSCRKLNKSRLLKRKSCRILMYHSIENSDLSEDKMGLAVPPETFYIHMKYLKENKFYVIGLLELVSKIANRQLIPKKSIVITFDDGFRSILMKALPILKKLSFTATLFINIYFVENKMPKHLYWHDWQTLNWDEIKRLYEEGLLIGSHAVTHKKLTELNEEDLKNEIMGSRELIERNIRAKINTFSYPQGAFNKKVKEALRNNNFICSCSSIEGTNDSQSDLFALRRTEITASDDTPLKFEKKILGSYDWLGMIDKWNVAG